MSNKNVQDDVTTVESKCKQSFTINPQELEGGLPVPEASTVGGSSTRPNIPFEEQIDAAVSELNEIQKGIYDVLIASSMLPTEALAKVAKDFAEFDNCRNFNSHFGVMLGYIGLKHEQALMILEISEQATLLEDCRRKIEQTLMSEIANEIDLAGKAVYSNPEKRSAELARRMEADPAIVELQTDIKQLRSDIETHKIEERFYSDLISAYKAFASTL